MRRLIAVVATVAFLGALLAPTHAEGQSTPTSDPRLVDAVGRSFTVAAFTLTGTLGLYVVIAEYEDDLRSRLPFPTNGT